MIQDLLGAVAYLVGYVVCIGGFAVVMFFTVRDMTRIVFRRYLRAFPNWSKQKAGIATLLTFAAIAAVGIALLIVFLLIVCYVDFDDKPVLAYCF